jgi:small subunit ribosomal protein S16
MITIRLKRTGTKSRKQWRIVVTDSRRGREGSLIEEIGFYNPHTEPPQFQIHREHYTEWLRKGAQPSSIVRSLVKGAKL